MKQQIIDSIKRRVEAEISVRNPLKYLIPMKVEDYVDTLISVVYLYTRPKRGPGKNSIFLTEVIAAIGHTIRGKFKLKRDSSLSAKTGAFLLYTFEELGMIQIVLGKGSNGHQTYIIQILDDDSICNLWNVLDPNKVEKLPSETPYVPWTTVRHPTGHMLVKTGNKEVLEKLSPETHPILFECVNRAQEVGWKINDDIYEISLWALRNKSEAFADIWEAASAEARTTKLREARAIGDIAGRFRGKTFYHLYSYDFRGRKYTNTAYLHEQGSDYAKGLLLRADSKPIGREGYFWLLVSIASNWAGDAGRSDGAKTDKIPLKSRASWVIDNEEIILSYAENPKVNQGWMQADSPWCFLAACKELMKLRIWQTEQGNFDDYSYSSHLECYIDGTNNGSQHLSALTRDEITAPHVNLVPLDMPGDLYKYVADHVWARLENLTAEYNKSELKECERFIDTLIDYKKKINECEPRSEQRQRVIDEFRAFKDANRTLLDISAPIYWLRVKDNKHKRKIVKRNVMTLPYGGTAYGLGEQQINDARKHGVDLLNHLEHKWGAYLGREIYEDCRVSLERPMRLLGVFEAAGRAAEERGEFLKWTVPITNFPVVQNYTEGKIKKIWVQYGPPQGEKLSTGYYENTLQLAVCFIEDVVPSKGRQATGASPNAIHSLDAAHLAITVARADYPITTIHDSFGCLLADMPKLFRLIRETFVELYQADPLTSLMNDIGGNINNIELGTLDVTMILDSEYCFC